MLGFFRLLHFLYSSLRRAECGNNTCQKYTGDLEKSALHAVWNGNVKNLFEKRLVECENLADFNMYNFIFVEQKHKHNYCRRRA